MIRFLPSCQVIQNPFLQKPTIGNIPEFFMKTEPQQVLCGELQSVCLVPLGCWQGEQSWLPVPLTQHTYLFSFPLGFQPVSPICQQN